ncbi:hypothetical protein C266_16010 [Pandoraea sp. SD6-2]|nr:hypothetical protein C266_16010 [Pandoraea sp. SD6-2]
MHGALLIAVNFHVSIQFDDGQRLADFDDSKALQLGDGGRVAHMRLVVFTKRSRDCVLVTSSRVA